MRLSCLNSLLDNNPLECDCAIKPYLFELATVTGTCAYPHHLRGVDISTIHPEDFQCGMFRNIIPHSFPTSPILSVEMNDSNILVV